MLSLDIYNVVFTVINLIILFLILTKFLIKPVSAIMEKRDSEIKNNLEAADHANQTANQLKAEYEASLHHAYETSEEIVKKAQATAREEAERIVREANEKAGKIVEEANRSIAMSREKAMEDMRSQIASLAMTAAVKMLSDQSREDNDRMLYDSFLTKAGEANDTNSN
ncbi:F0F1 ATP synthase subunit B [Ruminococcus sp. OA3]|uniref:F0F1 ATP synthase subunit B n=1 Tax=Ruminococcus sp. OA3 TaxID=2914164 RepID=UPI001F066F52|nr:F0F1 ATP synthase subunit B [Ruminococcus sp. OA3]MCH1983937.1 F0F1 ATP synthase subunit B [Ruminococcus sp. OA3]